MADEKNKSDVVGFRLELEDRDRLKQFMDQEGKGNKEFMQVLLNLYELNKGKIKNINLVGDIEELEKYTTKIQQTFINMIGKLEGQKERITEEKDKDLLLYKEKVNTLINDNDILKSANSANQIKLTDVNNDNILLNTQYNELQKNMKEKTEQLQQGLQDKITIIEEYKGKNDMLLGQLKQYEKYPEQLEVTKKLLIDSQTRSLEAESDLKEKGSNIIRLTDDIENLKNNHKSEINKIIENNKLEINNMVERHTQELERIKEKAEFDKEKALLAKDRLDQELINKINQENNAKIKELLHENQQYNEKFSRIMEENQIKDKEINGQDMKIKELILQVESKKELSKTKTNAK